MLFRFFPYPSLRALLAVGRRTSGMGPPRPPKSVAVRKLAVRRMRTLGCRPWEAGLMSQRDAMHLDFVSLAVSLVRRRSAAAMLAVGAVLLLVLTQSYCRDLFHPLNPML